MDRAAGLLTREELLDAIARETIETVLVAVPDWYGRLMGKRLTARFFAESVAAHGWHACDYVLACDMEMDPVPGYAFTSWESGYGDIRCLPDWTTLCRAAWLPKTAIVLCDAATEEGSVVEVAPRRILQRQVDRAAAMGFVAKGGAELELYLFRETYDSARQKHWHDLVPFAAYIEDYHLLQGTREEPVVGELVRALEKSGIPMEGSKGEWGPGQHELNIRADRAHGLGQAIACGAQSAADERRKFPPEHEDAHKAVVSFSLALRDARTLR